MKRSVRVAEAAVGFARVERLRLNILRKNKYSRNLMESSMRFIPSGYKTKMLKIIVFT